MATVFLLYFYIYLNELSHVFCFLVASMVEKGVMWSNREEEKLFVTVGSKAPETKIHSLQKPLRFGIGTKKIRSTEATVSFVQGAADERGGVCEACRRQRTLPSGCRNSAPRRSSFASRRITSRGAEDDRWGEQDVGSGYERWCRVKEHQ
ncbi:hypothetical protein AAZV13_11G211350 [Glycine max]